MTDKVKVYITGQISGLEESEYYRLFREAAELLMSNDFEPVNPLDVPAYCTLAGKTSCNSNETFLDGSYRHTWKCYMKSDIVALMDCDAIFPLDNAGNSKGAAVEMTIARALKMNFIYVNEDGSISWGTDR